MKSKSFARKLKGKVISFVVMLFLSIAGTGACNIISPMIEQSQSIELQNQAINQVDDTANAITGMIFTQQGYKIIRIACVFVVFILWIITAILAVRTIYFIYQKYGKE